MKNLKMTILLASISVVLLTGCDQMTYTFDPSIDQMCADKIMGTELAESLSGKERKEQKQKMIDRVKAECTK